MHDDDGAFEGVTDGARCVDIRCHILVGRFRTVERTIEGVHDDYGGGRIAELFADALDKVLVVPDHVEPFG